MTSFAEIIRNVAIYFEKINTNINEFNARKIEKIHNCYGIHSCEKIIAYCKTHPLGITINGCVFTDKAFYPKPVFLNSAPSNGDLVPTRIEYTDFDKYLIIQADEKDAVFMRGNQKNYFITFASLIKTNIAGCEIRKMLLAIQNHLCEIIPEARQSITDIAELLLKQAYNEFKSSTLSEETCRLLKGMVTADYQREHTLDILAEGIYRLCNEKKYVSLVNGYFDLIGKEKFDYYAAIPQKFKDDLIADLSNPNLTFDTDYINSIRYNLSKTEKTVENRKYNIFAEIRAGNIAEARCEINKLIKGFGREAAFIAEDFACLYGNKKASEVVKSLENNQNIPKELYNITDALGFTSLHYAIMLNCETAVRQLGGDKNFINKIDYCSNDEIKSLFEYTIPAFFQNTTLLNCIIFDTSAELAELHLQERKLKQQMEKAIMMLNSFKNEDRKICSKENMEFIKDLLHGKLNFDDTNEECSERRQFIKESIQKLENMLWDSKNELKKLNQLQQETFHNIIEQTTQTANALKNENNPVVNFFIALYENKASSAGFNVKTSQETSLSVSDNDTYHVLLNILETANEATDFRVYCCDGFYFMLPDFIELSVPYRKVHITSDGIIDDYGKNISAATSAAPIYGKTWFSAKAHHDEKYLKAEYRELVKKYHPDVCSAAKVSKIFIEIQNEYEKISNDIT